MVMNSSDVVYGSAYANNLLVFLHGYHQSASNAKMLISELVDAQSLHHYDLKIIFPKNTWFKYTDDSLKYDKESLHTSRKYIHQYLDDLVKTHTNILIGGYSQGACLAIDVALTYTKYLPVVSFSGFVLSKSALDGGEKYHRRLNLYYAHGINDSVIPLELARQSYTSILDVSENQTRSFTKQRKHFMLGHQSLFFKGDHWGFWTNRKVRSFFHNFLQNALIHSI